MLSWRVVAIFYLITMSSTRSIAAFCSVRNPTYGQIVTAFASGLFRQYRSPLSQSSSRVCLSVGLPIWNHFHSPSLTRTGLSSHAREGDSAGALREIISLREEGLISEEDFMNVKAEILASVVARASKISDGGIQRTDIVSEKLFRAKGPFSHVVKVKTISCTVYPLLTSIDSSSDCKATTTDYIRCSP
jgi:hypothetical protein